MTGLLSPDGKYILAQTIDQAWANHNNLRIYRMTSADINTISDISALWNYTILSYLGGLMFIINVVYFKTKILLLIAGVFINLVTLFPSRCEKIKPTLFWFKVPEFISHKLHLTGILMYVILVLINGGLYLNRISWVHKHKLKYGDTFYINGFLFVYVISNMLSFIDSKKIRSFLVYSLLLISLTYQQQSMIFSELFIVLGSFMLNIIILLDVN